MALIFYYIPCLNYKKNYWPGTFLAGYNSANLRGSTPRLSACLAVGQSIMLYITYHVHVHVHVKHHSAACYVKTCLYDRRR